MTITGVQWVTEQVIADALVLVSAGDSEQDAVTYAVAQVGRGWVDGAALAAALRLARPDTRRRHEQHHRDYVGHMLREAPYVCRHVRGDPLYWVHDAPECSPTCQQPPQHPRRSSEPVWGRCPTCRLTLPVSGRCDSC